MSAEQIRVSTPEVPSKLKLPQISTVLLVLGACVVVFPFVWMILGSFKTMQESSSYPPQVFPSQLRWENYQSAWQAPPNTLGRYFINTIIVAITGTVGQLVVCSLAAYAFAQLKFRGKDALFALVLGTMMIPGEITLIPNFMTIRHFPLMGGNDIFGSGGIGLYDSYAAQIIPGMVGAFNIFLLRQSFMQIPKDFWEAAQIDGSNSFRYLWEVVIPMSKPIMITVFLLGLVGRWNALLWPLIVTRDETLRPVQLAMIWYQGEFSTDQGVVMAASLLVTIPIVILFLIMQRHFIEGIVGSGLKG
ncbi:MAG: carbohydrate ABC transporter permease [Thermomicrobiales bacterium]|nr:carbohydrate ABC transporter permease [Thermomicrobiales bacterium]